MSRAPIELHLSLDESADALLSRDPLALLIGMLLDQQIPLETAFAGPEKLRERLGQLDAGELAEMDPERLVEVFRISPAVHRFPGSMAARVQQLCRVLVDEWGGDAAAIWTRDSPDGATVLARLKSLPGFGEQKARIFLALLGKQYGLDAPGWREAAGEYGEQGSLRSVADIVDADSLEKVRAAKKAAKAAARGTTT
jgi:uncharacterized HhH-GPD family protein